MTDETLPHPDSSPTPPGETPESWSSRLWQIGQTPLSDLKRFRLSPRRTVVAAIDQAQLSAELAGVVRSTVKATRLWPAEKVDVARELGGHFRDGLDAGATETDLRERFGDPAVAAKLIRRARLRCRPVWWQAWRCSLCAAGLFFLLYLALSARFFLSRPLITRFYVQELNDQVTAIPEDQRAWPFYRRALMAKVEYPRPAEGRSDKFVDGWWITEGNQADHNAPAWQQLQQYVDDNQDALRWIHEATQRPHRGIIYEDRADLDPAAVTESDKPAIGTLLPQLQEMRSFARLLSADAMLARGRRDGMRLFNDVKSMIAVAEHTRGFCVIEELVATVNLQIAMATVCDTLEDTPRLFTEEQWIDIAHQLAVYHGGGTIRFDLTGERWMLEDMLQRCYTDDGHGGGILTSEGLKLISEFSENSQVGTPYSVGTVGQTLLAPAAMLRSMSRQESQAVIDHLLAEAQAVRRGPLHTWQMSDPVAEWLCRERQRFGSPVAGHLVPAFSIPLLYFPDVRQADTAAERLCQARDATLTAIALELYRRQHGNLPTALEQLVPRYLPEPPLDRFTGETLRYRISEDQPVLYACGMDQQDDGGRHPERDHVDRLIFAKPLSAPAPGAGYDWVLFPRPTNEGSDTAKQPNR